MQGEKIIGELFEFSVTEPHSLHFEDNNIETMSFLINSGSIIIPIYGLMLFFFIMSTILHVTALCFFKISICRKMGMMVEFQTSDFVERSKKLFIEGFFELSLGAFLNIK